MRHPGDDHVLCRSRGSTGFLCAQVYSTAEDPQSHKVSHVPLKGPCLNKLVVVWFNVISQLSPSNLFTGTGPPWVILWPLSSTLCAPSRPCSFFSSSSLSFSRSWACRCLGGNSTFLTTDPDAVTLTTSPRPSSVCFRWGIHAASFYGSHEWIVSCFLTLDYLSDPNRRGLDLHHVQWHYGLRRAWDSWHPGLHLLYCPLCLWKLYPSNTLIMIQPWKEFAALLAALRFRSAVFISFLFWSTRWSLGVVFMIQGYFLFMFVWFILSAFSFFDCDSCDFNISDIFVMF